MKRATRLLVVFPLLSFAVSSCSMDLPSQRKFEEFVLSDGTKIKCPVPPPDVIAKGGKANAELTSQRLGTLLQAKGGVGLDVERIRQELPPEVSSFREVEFLICAQYGNNVLSKQEYRAFTEQIIPAYRMNPPAKTVSSTGTTSSPSLVERCGPSFTTKRPAVKFVPYWASQVEKLRTERNIQHHDLEHLMQVRGRIPVEMGMIDPYEELNFTLDCLERIGYLKVDKFDPPRMIGGGLVENRKIILSNPMMPVPQ